MNPTAPHPTPTAPISDQAIDQYRNEGYMVLQRVIDDQMLEMLREECAYFIGYKDGQMDEKGVTRQGITHRGRRYFIGNIYRLSHRLWRFIYGDLMAQLTRAALGPNVYLFNEQWVVKGPEQGMKFSWHQDSGYVKFSDPATTHAPYLTCWCALDDMSEANGTVYLLPHSRGQTNNRIIDHTQEQGSNDLIGYTGDDPGIRVDVPAGSIVAFSSYNLHRSGANTTPNLRRVYLGQYSAEPIVHSQTGKRWAQAVPFIKDGQVVYDPKTDPAAT